MFSSDFPPGVQYVFENATKLITPLLPIFIVAHWRFSNSAPTYIWIAAYILTIPSVALIKRAIHYLQEEQELKRFGARRIPKIRSDLPGGIDTVQKTVTSFSEGYPGDFWGGLKEKYGVKTLNAPMFWDDVILTIDPECIKIVLATDFENYEKGKRLKSCFQSVLGDGVFNSDGEMWKFHRGITRPFFARDRITDFELFHKKADLVISKLKDRLAEGEAVDFQDAMGRFTLDSATEFLFGSCVHSLCAQLPYPQTSPLSMTSATPSASDEFVKAFNEALHRISFRNLYGDSVWPLIEFLEDKTKAPMRVLSAYIDPILKNALAKKSSPGAAKGANAQTLLDHLVEETDDHVILRDEILNIMIAGRDTTMATLTFAVYCLSQHDDVLKKVRKEILDIIGPSGVPSYELLRECKYLRAVINETLRLYPAVPFNTRYSKRSTTWPASDGGKPYHIPGGVQIVYSVWLMHRSTDLWGPDANEFDPERFLDSRQDKYLTKNPFIFLPFNAGPRICLGQQFAYNETSFMLVRLLQAFDTITLSPEAQPLVSRPPPSWKSERGRQPKEKIWPKSHLTLYSFHGLWLKMGAAQCGDA